MDKHSERKELSYFSHIREEGQYLVFPESLPDTIIFFALDVRSGCFLDERPFTLNEIGKIALFASRELIKAATVDAKWFRSEIESGRMQDDARNRQLADATQLMHFDGSVAMLESWLGKAGNPVDWDSVDGLVNKDHVFQIACALALGHIDQSIKLLMTNDAVAALENMAFASKIYSTACHNEGWQIGHDWHESLIRAQLRKGGIQKNKKIATLKSWVIAQYEAGRWPSPHSASYALADLAIAKAKELKTSLSEQRAQKTIYDWLLAHLKSSKQAG